MKHLIGKHDFLSLNVSLSLSLSIFFSPLPLCLHSSDDFCVEFHLAERDGQNFNVFLLGHKHSMKYSSFVVCYLSYWSKTAKNGVWEGSVCHSV